MHFLFLTMSDLPLYAIAWSGWRWRVHLLVLFYAILTFNISASILASHIFNKLPICFSQFDISKSYKVALCHLLLSVLTRSGWRGLHLNRVTLFLSCQIQGNQSRAFICIRQGTIKVGPHIHQLCIS